MALRGDRNPDPQGARNHYPDLSLEPEARVGWFPRLRWFAVLMVLGGTVIGRALGYPVPILELLGVAAFIGIYNVVLLLVWRSYVKTEKLSPRFFHAFCMAQIFLDYLALTLTIHFTGGIESPATFFFVFHIIVAATLLPGRSAYWDALLASLLVGLVVLLEGTGVLKHYAVLFHDKAPFWKDPATAGAWFFFLILTFSISSLIASTIGASLERKIKALSDLKNTLQEAYEKLKEADREKTEFMNLVTHELRSPMVAIRSIHQTLLEQYAGSLNAQQRNLLERADKRAEQMIEMINDLLRLAKTSSGGRKEETLLDLAEETRAALEFFLPQAERKKLNLSWKGPNQKLVVKGDRSDLRYVISNLVSNAIKYTPEGGNVGVEVRREGAEAVLEVKDTGIGIPPEDFPKLFTEFFRATNAKQTSQVGTGLGLAISKKIVDSHGGTILVQSTLGKGSTFTVRLPCRC